MIYLDYLKKNVILSILVIVFAFLLFFNGIDSFWSYLCFLIFYILFVVVPISKNLYYENGTRVQEIFLGLLFILLTASILRSYFSLDSNNIIISLFLIVFLNYTSTTLQFSNKYHPTISTSNIVNMVIILICIISLVYGVLSDLIPYDDIIYNYILFICFILTAIIYKMKNREKILL